MSEGASTQDLLGTAGALWSVASSPAGLPYLLTVVRLFGLALAAPLFPSRVVPVRLRAAIAVVLGLALARGGADVAGFAPVALPGVLAGELLVGAVTGWVAFLVMAAVRSAAVAISEQAGFSFGGVLDPSTQAGEPMLRGLFGGLALFVFVAADLHHALLRGVADSLSVVPPGSLAAGGVVAGAERLAAAAGVFLFEAALLVALPVLAVLLLAAVAQGVLARLFPELETVLFGFLVRAGLAVGVIAATLPALVETTQRLFGDAVAESVVILGEMAR